MDDPNGKGSSCSGAIVYQGGEQGNLRMTLKWGHHNAFANSPWPSDNPTNDPSYSGSAPRGAVMPLLIPLALAPEGAAVNPSDLTRVPTALSKESVGKSVTYVFW
jgi:hypothetical protein